MCTSLKPFHSSISLDIFVKNVIFMIYNFIFEILNNHQEETCANIYFSFMFTENQAIQPHTHSQDNTVLGVVVLDRVELLQKEKTEIESLLRVTLQMQAVDHPREAAPFKQS